MTATVDEIQAGIKDRLETIAGLHAYATEPEKPNPPQAYPRLVDWTYDQSMEFGGEIAMLYHFDVWVLVPMTPDFNRAQTMLNPYLSASGTRSVKTAIEEDVTLGGTVDSCRVTGGGAYGKAEIAGIAVLGASMRLEIFA